MIRGNLPGIAVNLCQQPRDHLVPVIERTASLAQDDRRAGPATPLRAQRGLGDVEDGGEFLRADRPTRKSSYSLNLFGKWRHDATMAPARGRFVASRSLGAIKRRSGYMPCELPVRMR